MFVSLPHTITVHQSCGDVACVQIKHAATLHFDSIYTGSSLEIIFVSNIISKCVFHLARCNRYHNILHLKTIDLIVLFDFSQQDCMQMRWDQCYMLTTTVKTWYTHLYTAYCMNNIYVQSCRSQNHEHTKHWSHPSAMYTVKVTCHASWWC